MSSVAKVVVWSVGLAALAFIVLMIAAPGTPRTGAEIMADIRKNCEREYGPYDKAKIDSCVIAVSVKKITDAEDAKLKRAYEASR